MNPEALKNKFAFPIASHGGTLHDGMTLREHYAGLALKGLLGNSGYHSVGFEMIADEAVQAADALIAALAN